MNNAHSGILAVTDAPCGGMVMARRVVAACMLLVTSNLALAGDPPQNEQRYPQQRSERAAQQREDVRHFDPRAYEARVDEQRRRAQMDNGNQSDRRGGRLTPDERRDLRRQINEAGADIYPNTPRR